MAMKGHKPAGGIKSRNVTNRSAPKAEPKPHAKIVAGVAQLGQRQGNHVMGKTDRLGYEGVDMRGGRGYSTPVGPTDNVKGVGVGGGREVMRSGSQCQTGPANPGQPMKPSKPLFPGWEK